MSNYRLTVIGESKAQLANKTLREWLRRAGLSVCSGWPSNEPGSKPEDVYFCELFDPLPEGIPVLALGPDVTASMGGYTLTSLKTRGTLVPRREGGWFVSTIRPEECDFPKGQDELKPFLAIDSRRALDSNGPTIPTVHSLRSPATLPVPGKGTLVSVDIEGANGQPNIVGVSWQEDQAYVFDWNEETRAWLTSLFETCITTFHNAAFDVPELEAAGVPPPKVWWDTINMAALYDPSVPMNLQGQVLTHVPGSITWKSLVSHEKGPDFEGGQVGVYRQLWAEVLTRLGRRPPDTGSQWYRHYNALDAAWGLALANNLKRKLEAQGRWQYYTDVMLPLQRPLLEIGNRGMPVDEARIAAHRVECQAKVAAANETLRQAGAKMLEERATTLHAEVFKLEEERDKIYAIAHKKVVFHRAKELTAARNKWRTADRACTEGFNADSHPQRAALLYEWFGLPPSRKRGAKGLTTDDTTITDLLSRLDRGTIKPKRGTREEVRPVLEALIEAKKWAVLERTFLNPELV